MRAYWLDTDEPIMVNQLIHEGVYYEALDVSHYQNDLDRIKDEEGYVAQDIVELKPDTPNLDQIEAKFDKEHIHTDDEVRFVLEGEGIFDIRSTQDKWMRIHVEAGDYLSVPKNRNHRFFLTDKKTIRCVRLFMDDSGWTPIYREASKQS